MCKTNFYGHSKIWGAQKNWGTLPPNAPLGYSLACKTKVSHMELDENFAALYFWLNSSEVNQMT